MKTMKTFFETRAIVFKEENRWTVQGLDYDVAAQGPSPQLAVKAFEKQFQKEVVLDNHFDPIKDEITLRIPMAPRKYWEIWNKLNASGPRGIQTTSSFVPKRSEAFTTKLAIPAGV